ncbi:hypothetical protein EMPS_01099 [Entomortierella parvispora]|uniref:Uncharacterized protein n=1 Tax=Entomortierella parvispora TaxID=205924 RepID=A0A9P3LS92_9FUNG|nr:hypothetical protein EMPS_01099 [Entomortierella parvispora]
MKIFTSLALALTVLAATTSAAPSPSPADAVGGLLQSMTGAVPFGGAGGQPMTETASPASILRKRHGGSHADAVLDAIVNINTKIVAKALLTLKTHLCSDIRAKIHVAASGLLSADTVVIVPKISAKVETETHSAINNKVDTDAKVLVLDKVRQHGHECIIRRCPYLDDRCISKHAREIVKDVEALVRVDVLHLFVALKVNLMTHVRTKVGVVLRNLGINLLLEQIHVQGKIDAAAEVDVHLDTCSHIIVKGLHATVLPHAISVIRKICRGN